MFPLPVKHLQNVKNKNVYFTKFHIYYSWKKRTAGSKYWNIYFHWQVRTSVVTWDQCFLRLNVAETAWTFSYQLSWEFLLNWWNQPSYSDFPATIIYFLKQKVSFRLTYIKLQRHLFLRRKRTNGHPLLTFIRHYQHHTAIFAPSGNHKRSMKENTILKKSQFLHRSRTRKAQIVYF